MKKILLPFIGLCFTFILFNTSFSQEWMPVILNERGDTVHYEYPPPDSSYVHNKLIIRFRANALNLWELCYVIPQPIINEKKEKTQSIPAYLKSYLMSQKFYVDNLIADSALLASIKSFGGDTLMRITSANPCSDTISIARNGNTLKCEDYLWMTLHLDNNTSVIMASIFLTGFFQNYIAIAQPNFLYQPCKMPNDTLYFKQRSLQPEYIGAERAWDFTTGKHEIKIGIIDDGLDYRHPDLGGGKGWNKKVTDGWSWLSNSSEFWEYSTHGTPIAGIAAALTNNSDTLGKIEGIAGIAGGWGNAGFDNLDSLGCQLLGFQPIDSVKTDTLPWSGRFVYTTEYLTGAIREASAWTQTYGYGVHILNNSYGFANFDPALWAAVHWASEHGVSFVAARGNDGNDSAFYPACLFPSGVISVGGSNEFKKKWSGSQFGKDMDILAPAEDLIWTTSYKDPMSQFFGYNAFNQTSAATPHVTGVVGLLRSFALEKGWHDFLEPEDYEGMIKASAYDLTEREDPLYKVGYDSLTSWGHLKADNIFNMLNFDMNNRVYRVSHITNVQTLDSSEWSGLDTITFYNEGRFGKLLDSAAYKVKKRKRFGIISLSDDKWIVDPINKLYVWGRSGQGSIGGYSGEKPNYQNRWTLVTSGSGGNGFVEGIIHNDSLNVAAYTFQYQVWDFLDNYLGIFPPEGQLALNISVFGKEITPVNVRESKPANNPYDILLSPNPADEELKVSIVLKNPVNIKIEILDYFGNIVYKTNDTNLESGNYLLNINTGNYNSGVYFCRANINRTIISKSFVILK